MERVDEFEGELERVKIAPDGHHAAAAHLRGFLKPFATAAIKHCRTAESRLARCADAPARREFCEYHERFGVDMDRFDRQIASYELSADPVVLLMLGSRIIREFRTHLCAEQELLTGLGTII